MKKRVKPDIRAITRLVPPEGNLVQGQSELPIHPRLAEEAAKVISANQNHYGASEGEQQLRRAVVEKVRKFNNIDLNSDEMEVMITSGGTGALVGIAVSFLKNRSALVFEPYYPYHCRIVEQFGGKIEKFELNENLSFDKNELFERCQVLKRRSEYPLSAIIVCSPANPSGKVLNFEELKAVAEVATKLDLMVISDEVYEHYVCGNNPHISIASFFDMRKRTITVNSFSKSWNISGWRLGYCYGPKELISQVNSVANVVYVCPATPLQKALAEVLLSEEDYYELLRRDFERKWKFFANELRNLGFQVYESGSAFYVWAGIPEKFDDSVSFNQMLMEKQQVAGVPGSAFSDSGRWDAFMRFCIAREDSILEIALKKIKNALNSS
ncbi:MAG: pyridoxal phosphate-dependent aminotransferase [Pyrinomonadaceae bacterium]|nr:pyridoxal phosphate-dependent aminotransferase [Pyrinomonadaceae bacterium]